MKRSSPTPPASLVGIQTFLLGAFQREDALEDDAVAREQARGVVTGNDRLTPAEQVDIYRRQFWLRHEACLLEDFPALHAIIGDARWEDFVRGYLRAHPPTARNLRDLGQSALVFFDAWAPSAGLDAERRALARDAVIYELAFVDVFDGKDPPPFPTSKLAALRPEQIASARLVLSPLVRRMALSGPIHTFRKAVRGGESPSLPPLEPTFIALFRRDLVVHFEALSEPAFRLLAALDQGEPLALACETAARGLDEGAQQELASSIGKWFEHWGAWGFLVDVIATGD